MMAVEGVRKQRQRFFTDLLHTLGQINPRVGSGPQIRAVLEPWLHDESSALPDKLAIPLKEKYSKKDLSFKGLKKKDLNVAEALKNCRDSNGKPMVDVFLCIVTLFRTGSVACTYGERSYAPPPSWVPGSCYDPPSEDEDEDGSYGFTIGEIDEERLEKTKCRIDWNDKPVKDKWIIEEDDIVVWDDKNWTSCFDIDNPNKAKYDPDDEYLDEWYHQAMLVVQPSEEESEEDEEDSEGGGVQEEEGDENEEEEDREGAGEDEEVSEGGDVQEDEDESEDEGGGEEEEEKEGEEEGEGEEEEEEGEEDQYEEESDIDDPNSASSVQDPDEPDKKRRRL